MSPRNPNSGKSRAREPEPVAEPDEPHGAGLDRYDFAILRELQADARLSNIELAGRIGHVQSADGPGRGEPGSGKTDFEPALRALREDDYPGWLGAEYKPAGVTADSLGWLAEWKARQL